MSGPTNVPGAWIRDRQLRAQDPRDPNVDRLLHHAHVCQTTGESMRLPQALAGQGEPVELSTHAGEGQPGQFS